MEVGPGTPDGRGPHAGPEAAASRAAAAAWMAASMPGIFWLVMSGMGMEASAASVASRACASTPASPKNERGEMKLCRCSRGDRAVKHCNQSLTQTQTALFQLNKGDFQKGLWHDAASPSHVLRPELRRWGACHGRRQSAWAAKAPPPAAAASNMLLACRSGSEGTFGTKTMPVQ